MTSEAMIENTLFNEKKMEEFIELYDDALTVNADCDPISYWIKKLDQDELKNEKANYIKFFKIILENILGYEFTDIQYEENIGDEGRPVEFTLKKDGKDYVVVELKGTTCKDLNKRYNREQSPIEQVTNYASIKEETQWAFVSNYNEFRFFNPSYREKYISFKFKQLTDPDVLKRFLLIFSKFSLIDKDIPQTLLKETKIIERELEDEFYKLFSETRLMLIKELEFSSEDIDRIEAIRLAQLILNRFIFLCFAEDLRLIPSETTADVILTPIKHKNLFEFTMWDRLNELFRFADKGNMERGINAFNGGLFKESLRHLEIRDKVEDLKFFEDCYKTWEFEEKYQEIESLLGVYKNTLNPIYKNLLLISSFDFGSELSVNILGHIFENSIGDIEELKDETTERRKKEGVFYTPEHITDYICRNTIIPYLSINGKATTTHELISEYENSNSLDELDKKLKEIKIIDISCGSGAFLNKAVDVLFEIHKAYHDSKYANDPTLNKYFDSLDSRRQIIINNIYGVDVNEESVEITKLSLFLKLATSTGVKQGFKLPNLNKNIKCGNSIIDSKEYDNKAFNWKLEFEDILNNGGFDIIIGNPPYVRNEEIKPIKDYLKKEYETYSGLADLYVYFFEKGLNILKRKGLLSFICSNKYLKAKYGLNLRKLLLSVDILRYNDYTGENIFESANVDTSTIILKNNHDLNNEILIDNDFYLPQLTLDVNSFIFEKREIKKLKNKILSNGELLKNLDITINRCIRTGFNKAFIINDKIKENLLKQNSSAIQIIKPLLRGRDINRWQINFNNLYILLIRDYEEIINNYPIIYDYLKQYEESLKNRSQVIRGDHHWLELDNNTSDEYCSLFDKEKLIYAEITPEPRFIYDDEKYYANDSIFIINSDTINLKYLVALLNSKLLFWYFKDICYNFGGKGFIYKKQFVERIPIFITEDKDTEMKLSNLAEMIIDENKKLVNEINSFHKWLNRTFNIDKLSKKLENYHELDFEDFLKEIKKKKVNIKQRKTQELLETEFNESIATIKPLQKEIQELETEINQLVYSLYGLTAEEIDIIENSFKE